MSKNAVSIFTQNAAAVPAHIAAAVADEEGNIAPKMTVPTLSYEGKVWTVILNGEKTRLSRRNDDGDLEPITTFKGIILNYNKARGRTYYEGGYDPAKPAMPVCWSHDGKTPDDSVETPVSPKCEGCPMAAKGSRVTDNGKPTKACSEHRMLAVIPSGKLDFQPLRMKIAITSDWDNQSPDLAQDGWFAFTQYLDEFRKAQINHTGVVVTKMRFDNSVAFPKVLFSFDRYLNEDEVAKTKHLWKDAAVQSLVDGSFTPNGGDGVKKEEKSSIPPRQAAPKVVDEDTTVEVPAQKPKAAAKPAPVVEEAEEVPFEVEEPKPAPKAAAKPKAAPKPADDEGEMVMEEDPAPVATTKPKAAAKPAPAAADDDAMPEFLDRRSPAVKAAAAASKPAAAAKPKAEAAEPKKAGGDELEALLDEWN